MRKPSNFVYLENRRYYLEKMGGECVECGAVDHLHFDHIHPSSKTICIVEVLRLTMLHNKEFIDSEMSKCQILCKDCHKKKTALEWANKVLFSTKSRSTHGTASRYTNYRCRCSKCTIAWRKYCFAKRKRLQLVRG